MLKSSESKIIETIKENKMMLSSVDTYIKDMHNKSADSLTAKLSGYGCACGDYGCGCGSYGGACGDSYGAGCFGYGCACGPGGYGCGC